MNQNVLTKLSEMMQSAARSHPAFSGLEGAAGTDFMKNWTAAAQAMMTPGSPAWGDWLKSWTDYQTSMAQLWMGALQGQTGEPSGDGRFKNDAWNKGLYPFLRQSYELTAKAMVDMADRAGLPDNEQRKLSFYARMTADGLAPSNFLALNPEVLQMAQETGGQSLIDGFRNVLADLQKGYISTTDETAFQVGENLATTPGAVVYRNELIELIQYTPMTAKQRGAPILIVPPCVNKFYIFDINDKKSMVRYMLEQGQAVYMVSWRNAGPDTQDYDWNDYIRRGILESIDAVADIGKADKIDLLSWCNGGTMMLAALAVMPKAQKEKVASATFMSSMLDFSDPGEIKHLVDQPEMRAYKRRMDMARVAPGRDIARAMAMLHVNESIWGFVINNYLKGQQPAPFDILYWNADTSNLPVKWFTYFVEEMYQKNLLMQPGALTLLDTPVDCGNIDIPCCFIAATGDHIVPWETSYSSAKLLPDVTEFILTSGGHVSGTVINHPVKNRRWFKAGGDRTLSAEEWQATAPKTEGSWWPHWLEWLGTTTGTEDRAAPRSLGNRSFPELAPAPGTYVLEDVPQDGRP